MHVYHHPRQVHLDLSLSLSLSSSQYIFSHIYAYAYTKCIHTFTLVLTAMSSFIARRRLQMSKRVPSHTLLIFMYVFTCVVVTYIHKDTITYIYTYILHISANICRLELPAGVAGRGCGVTCIHAYIHSCTIKHTFIDTFITSCLIFTA